MHSEAKKWGAIIRAGAIIGTNTVFMFPMVKLIFRNKGNPI